ncbi:uncharacterized serine-rich protein C215.13-like [Glossina fuscipes]|uniref:Uncharacterized serine-rich protein C215.13-like n=1 Tax=Glossina fuscipes TaxID=7396 RepID=A0A9C5ZPV9_9MUSC|nr:uncharacterized serine-rich protein C215.13-like [Glossina fuscipes]
MAQDIVIKQDKPSKTYTTTTNQNFGSKQGLNIEKTIVTTTNTQYSKPRTAIDKVVTTNTKTTTYSRPIAIEKVTFTNISSPSQGQKLSKISTTTTYTKPETKEKISTTSYSKPQTAEKLITNNVSSYVSPKGFENTVNNERGKVKIVSTDYQNKRPEQKVTTVTTGKTTSYQQQTASPRPTSSPFQAQKANNYCSCPADTIQSTKSSSSSTTYTAPSSKGFATSPQSLPNLVSHFQQEFITSSGFSGHVNFPALSQQIPVVPQVPGHPAFYPPDKIPNGATVAFLPIIILPEVAYGKCNDNANKSTSEHIHTVGVQPAPIPINFSLNSIFSNGSNKSQCMCPCSCTQNIPEHQPKKRETNLATTVKNMRKNRAVDNDEIEQTSQPDSKSVANESSYVSIDDIKQI